MPKIEIEKLTDSQKVVAEMFIFEGVLRGYEEVLEGLEHEYNLSMGEDPYYGYYVKHVIDLVREKYDALNKEVSGE